MRPMVCIVVTLLLAGACGEDKPTQSGYERREVPLAKGAIAVKAGQYQYFSFAVPTGKEIKNLFAQGTFTVTEGVAGTDGFGQPIYEREIRAFVLGEAAFLNWANGAQFLGAYASGRVASDTFRVPVDPPGNFHIVFDNTYSFTYKTVDVNVVAVYDEGGAGP